MSAARLIEVIETRAFAGGLGMGFPGVVANLEHEPRALLATVDSGTLDISNTSAGLGYEFECPNTSVGNDTLEYIDSGLIRGSSIQMQVRGDHFERRGGTVTRHLDEIQLMALSPVATPAYPDATIQRRSLDLAFASFATQFDASEEEVRHDFETGNTARYFDNRNPVVIDVKPVPTPLAVAERRSSDDLDLRRRRNELYAKIDIQPRAAGSDELDLRRRRNELMRRKLLWDAPTEARSLTDDFARDRYGHAVDWYPGRA
jgi:HK97 family phage prohead protease